MSHFDPKLGLLSQIMLNLAFFSTEAIFNTARGDPLDVYRSGAFESPNGSPRTEESETSFNSARSNDRSFRTAGSLGTARSGRVSQLQSL